MNTSTVRSRAVRVSSSFTAAIRTSNAVPACDAVHRAEGREHEEQRADGCQRPHPAAAAAPSRAAPPHSASCGDAAGSRWPRRAAARHARRAPRQSRRGPSPAPASRMLACSGMIGGYLEQRERRETVLAVRTSDVRRDLVPGSRRPKASPRSCASITQRHNCDSRASASSPARLSQSKTCEVTSVPANCLACRPCRAHTPSRRCDAASRRAGTASGRRSPRRRAHGPARRRCRSRRPAASGRGAPAAARQSHDSRVHDRPRAEQAQRMPRRDLEARRADTGPRRAAAIVQLRSRPWRRQSRSAGAGARVVRAQISMRARGATDAIREQDAKRTRRPTNAGSVVVQPQREPGERAVAVVHRRRARRRRAGR